MLCSIHWRAVDCIRQLGQRVVCPTITATVGWRSAASVIHHDGKRKYSVAELKVLSSFPQDFELVGNFTQNCERIGRSVPPLMMKALAENIKTNILDKL